MLVTTAWREDEVAEAVVVICDVCGKPATETATIRVNGRNFVKDYCATHLSELTAGARAPRRGRRRAVVGGGRSAQGATTPRRRGRPPKSAGAKRAGTKRAGAKRSAAKRSGATRRGRPRKA